MNQPKCRTGIGVERSSPNTSCRRGVSCRAWRCGLLRIPCSPAATRAPKLAEELLGFLAGEGHRVFEKELVVLVVLGRIGEVPAPVEIGRHHGLVLGLRLLEQ